MEFNKNEMINETLDKYFETWQHTQDTADFVNEKFLKKIDKYIFVNMKKKLKDIDVFDLLMLKDKGVKLGLFDKIKVFVSRATRVYEAEKRERELLKNEDVKRRRAKVSKIVSGEHKSETDVLQ